MVAVTHASVKVNVKSWVSLTFEVVPVVQVIRIVYAPAGTPVLSLVAKVHYRVLVLKFPTVAPLLIVHSSITVPGSLVVSQVYVFAHVLGLTVKSATVNSA